MIRGVLGSRASIGGVLGSGRGGAAAAWYLAGGVSAANCVAAYQPIGAASLAASYVNLANPGTYDAAVMGAGCGLGANGWIGDAANTIVNYLACGATIQPTWTIIARQYHAGGAFGVYTWGTNNLTIAYMARTATTARFVNGGIKDVTITTAEHVAALVGTSGVAVDGTYTSNTFTGGTADTLRMCIYPSGTMAAIAIYNVTLDAATVAAISAAMAAL